MGALEQVTQLKSQGISENEIINRLQEQGISPRAITDALAQSKIKEAVSNPAMGGGMENSIMDEQPEQIKTASYSPKTKEIGPPKSEGFYVPRPQQNYPPQQNYVEEYSPQDYYPGTAEQGAEGYAPQEGTDYYSATGGTDTDTMIEISEQVFSEKIRKTQKQVDELENFMEIAQTKINHSEERLKRIEFSLDKLQAAILEKIGSYGAGLESIRKEMSMMQDSFSKTLPALAEHYTEHENKKVSKK